MPLYAASLAQIDDSQAKADGLAVGATVAQVMLTDRADDGRYVPFSYTAGSRPGQWRPDLPGFVSDPLHGSQRPAVHHDRHWAVPHGWPVRPGQRRVRGRLQRGQCPGLTADAGIGCTDDKRHWGFWRPITAIREAANDGNPDTAPQEGWTPFFATPPYPDHPSGYNCFVGAMMHTAAGFFGPRKIGFELASPVTGTVRSYDRFTAVLKDTIDARIWQGLHFRNPDVQGAWLGKKVAQWVAKHYFRAVD